MGSDVVLSAGVRQNLLSLQSTAQLMSITQNRLATGKKVNSALDNPVNFFTSSGLSTRAKDLSALLDSMENGIKTIEAADNGITSIKKTIESMKSTLLQARQDKSFKSTAYSVALTAPAATDVLALSGGAVTGTVNVDLTNSQAVRTSASNYANMDFSSAANTFDGVLNFTIAVNGGTARAVQVAITSDTNMTVSVDGGPVTNYAIADADIVTGADMVGALNAGFRRQQRRRHGRRRDGLAAGLHVQHRRQQQPRPTSWSPPARSPPRRLRPASTPPARSPRPASWRRPSTRSSPASTPTPLLTDKVTASNDSGRLRISNLSTGDLTLVGATAGGVVNGDIGAANTTTIGGNVVRRNLVKQYNDLRDQLNKLADDASFNGINLLRGDKLRINFNELGTTSINVQAQDEFGTPRPINTTHARHRPAPEPGRRRRRLDRRLPGRPHRRPQYAALAGLELRIEPVAGGDPHRIHQADDQHAAGRRRQSRARRHQRGRRQHAGAADPPAALHHGTVAGLAGRPSSAAPVRLTNPTHRTGHAAGRSPAAFFTLG